jgi:hypothetical protein
MKFCGECGAPLASAGEAPVATPRILPAREPEAPNLETKLHRPVVESSPAPAHTGGAFRLGGHDTEHAPRNLDYLLEDDEEPGSGRGALVVGLLFALALAGGLGYWHYRNGGWPGLKPAAGATTNAPVAGGSNSGDNPVSSTEAPSATADGANATPGGGSAPAQGVPTAAITDVRPQNPVEGAPAATPEAPAKPTAPAPTRTGATKAATHERSVAPSKPQPPPRTEAPVKAEDSVTLGEKYIYGRGGFPQNCERGLKIVKPAADQSNDKAMITMGALYATGHCVTRDLPTAYRYFALALRKDPENAALKQNAEMVWGQMTPSERQQAIRLTQ